MVVVKSFVQGLQVVEFDHTFPVEVEHSGKSRLGDICLWEHHLNTLNVKHKFQATELIFSGRQSKTKWYTAKQTNTFL